MDRLTAASMMPSEKLFVLSDEAKQLGLVIRYDTIEYRNERIDFLSSVDGVQCFAQWRGKLIDLGLNNLYYKEDICKYIDRELDLITDFRNCPNFVGAKLEYFHNGDFRDIRLVYQGRILKVFLVASEATETFVISESINILNNFVLLTES